MSGIYTSTSGMMSNITKLNIHSNNIANSETVGYKHDKVTFKAFDEAFMKMDYKKETKPLGHYHDQVYVDNVHTMFESGAAKVTDKDLDFFLHDDVMKGNTSFFVVQKGEETFLTRNGKFRIDSERRLSTHNGALVLGQGGEPIKIPVGSQFFTRDDGKIIAYKQPLLNENYENEVLGQLQIKTVNEDALGLLEKKFGGFFQPMSDEKIEKMYGSIDNVLNRFDGNMTLQSVFGNKEVAQKVKEEGVNSIIEPFQGEVKSGVLEGSNVNMVDEMTSLMETQRHFQANQKSFTIMNQVLAKDANEIGK